MLTCTVSRAKLIVMALICLAATGWALDTETQPAVPLKPVEGQEKMAPPVDSERPTADPQAKDTPANPVDIGGFLKDMEKNSHRLFRSNSRKSWLNALRFLIIRLASYMGSKT